MPAAIDMSSPLRCGFALIMRRLRTFVDGIFLPLSYWARAARNGKKEGLTAQESQGECLDILRGVLDVQGSFDYVAASLREAATPLRMTFVWAARPPLKPGPSQKLARIKASLLPAAAKAGTFSAPLAVCLKAYPDTKREFFLSL
jgi:hypothetical protein